MAAAPEEVEYALKRDFEEHLREGLESISFNGRRSIWLRGEGVALEGSYPDTTLVVRFRLTDLPDTVFGWRWRVWAELPESSEGGIALVNFDEMASTRPRYVQQEPDPDGVVWVPWIYD